MKEYKYISDKIGEEYKKWKEYDTIFITAPTGKGKSYFILHDLLEYVIKSFRENPKLINGNYKPKKILYLVNRKILQQQIEEEKRKIEYSLRDKLNLRDISDFIEVMTYQKIEEELKNQYSQESGILSHLMYEHYKYIIYDECHYFSVDSTYNTFTELSYDFLRNTYFGRVQIFLSATMDNIKNILENRKEVIVPGLHSKAYGLQVLEMRNIKSSPYEYLVEADYSNVNIRIIKDKNILKELIIKNWFQKKEKWLIFTDSISQGKKLKEEISNFVDKEEKDNIVFVNANYKEDETAFETVNQIVDKNYSSKKIIITTSVMDNGISIKDIEVRNIVIMADTQEEFIQMIGRKRFEHEEDNITIYIMERNISYFNFRYQYYNNILTFYEKYKNTLGNNNYLLCKYMPENYVWDISKQPYTSDLYGLYNFPYSIKNQQKPLEDILQCDDMGKILTYPYKGKLNFNYFSVERCKYLRGFYQNTIEELKKDPNYFIKLQYSWLGKVINDGDIQYAFEEEIKIHKQKIVEVIEKNIGKKLDKEKNIEFKNSIKDDVKSLLKIFSIPAENIEKLLHNILHNLSDNNASISVDTFNNIMECVDLNYQMSKPDKSTFLIEKSNLECQN